MNTPLPLTASGTSSYAEETNSLAVSGDLDRAHTYTDLRMANGQVFRLPTELLLSAAAPDVNHHETQASSPRPAEGLGTQIVPIVEEQLTVGKRTIVTGTVRLQKSVQEYQQSLDEALAIRTFDIERIVLNRPIETVPEIRHEGETTIYPLTEERLVLTKELILKEELHVTRRDTERRDTQVVTLRRENITVERVPAEVEVGNTKS